MFWSAWDTLRISSPWLSAVPSHLTAFYSQPCIYGDWEQNDSRWLEAASGIILWSIQEVFFQIREYDAFSQQAEVANGQEKLPWVHGGGPAWDQLRASGGESTTGWRTDEMDPPLWDRSMQSFTLRQPAKKLWPNQEYWGLSTSPQVAASLLTLSIPSCKFTISQESWNSRNTLWAHMAHLIPVNFLLTAKAHTSPSFPFLTLTPPKILWSLLQCVLRKRSGQGLDSSQLLCLGDRRSLVEGAKFHGALRRCQRSYRGSCSSGEAEDFCSDGKVCWISVWTWVILLF